MTDAPHIKACVKCEHYERVKSNANPLWPLSTHICHATYDPVTGDPLAVACVHARGIAGACGPLGALFVEYVREPT